MRLVVVCAALVSRGAPCGHGPRSAKEVTTFAVRLVHYEGFSFVGRPPKVYDNGSLIFNRTHAAALRARAKLDAALIAAAA